jgi:hypothetical protein
MIRTAKFMPPPPKPSDFFVTVWLRDGGLVRSIKVATDACDEQSARDNALRSLGLTFDGRDKSVVDIRIRRRG